MYSESKLCKDSTSVITVTFGLGFCLGCVFFIHFVNVFACFFLNNALKFEDRFRILVQFHFRIHGLNCPVTYIFSGMIFLRFLPEFRFFELSCGNPRTGLKIWAIFMGGGGYICWVIYLIDLLLSRLNTLLQCFINPSHMYSQSTHCL